MLQSCQNNIKYSDDDDDDIPVTSVSEYLQSKQIEPCLLTQITLDLRP